MNLTNKKNTTFYNNKFNQVNKSSYYKDLYYIKLNTSEKKYKSKLNTKVDDSTPSKND